jgi:non-ribosomal peptide synthetase-like protein
VEARLERVWAELFGRESVSCADDFFADLGGHSLLAAEMISTLRDEFGDLSVLDLYNNPTVAGLARHCAPRTATVAPARPPISRTRYLAAAAVQSAGVYFLFGLTATQWLVPFLLWTALHRSAPLALAETLSVLLALHPALLVLTIALKWAVLGKAKPGRYPLWSVYYLRWWFVDRLLSLAPTGALAGTPLINVFYRLLGARIGRHVFIGSDAINAPDLVSIGDDSAIGMEVALRPARVEDGTLVLAPIRIGRRCTVGTGALLAGGAALGDDASVGELSLLSGAVPGGEHWVGSPARFAGAAFLGVVTRPGHLQRVWFCAASTICAIAVPLYTLTAAVPGVIALHHAQEKWGGYWYLLLSPAVALAFVLIVALNIAAAKWLLLGKVAPGRHRLFGGFYLRWWIFEQSMAVSLDVIGGLFATLFLNPWYRLLGVRLGRHSEVSTAAAHAPDLLEVGDDAFVADAVSLGAPRISRGTMELKATMIGNRSFIGNSAVVPGGRTIADDCLVGCLSSAPAASTAGKSWFGSPAVELPQRHASAAFSLEETFRPPRGLVVRRLLMESLRILLPPTCMVVLTCLSLRVAGVLPRLALIAVFPLLGIAAGAVAALFAIGMKWLLMGRYRPVEKPLWSGFVWRTELITALHENLVDPLLNELLMGTPFAAWFYRSLGAKIGKRVYLGTSYFTEYDLVEIGDDACLNEDATIQTHLFEDRVMKMSRIHIGDRCTVGASAVVLYDSIMRDGSSLGPLSLLMKGETLPAASSWEGSPAQRVE